MSELSPETARVVENTVEEPIYHPYTNSSAERVTEAGSSVAKIPINGMQEADHDWRDLAHCSTADGSMARLFFSDVTDDISAAKAVCSHCPVAVECLEGALRRQEPHGVWGGELFRNGRPSNIHQPGKSKARI